MLESLFRPASIAVVGASNDQRKVGHSVLRNLCQFKFAGRLYPVNPAGGEILGLRAYAKIGDIGQPVDLAVIVIPAPFVPAALRECAAAGIHSAIVISAGFKEAGKEGTLLDACRRLSQVSLGLGVGVGARVGTAQVPGSKPHGQSETLQKPRLGS